MIALALVKRTMDKHALQEVSVCLPIVLMVIVVILLAAVIVTGVMLLVL